jgi:L-arabinose isomerase
MAKIEFILINNDTKLYNLKNELKWNDLIWQLR